MPNGQLSEVVTPWCITADDQARAVASYLKGETLHGWEHRDDVGARLAVLESDFTYLEEELSIVSHGVLLTTLLDRQIGLKDAYGLWANLRMPDAWVADFEDRSLQRIVAH